MQQNFWEQGNLKKANFREHLNLFLGNKGTCLPPGRPSDPPLNGIDVRGWRIHILVPRAYDPSGLRQESRALGATIVKEQRNNQILVIRLTAHLRLWRMPEMVAPRALDSCHRPERS